MQAEMRVMYFKPRNAKDWGLSPDARREAWNRFSFRALKWNQAC